MTAKLFNKMESTYRAPDNMDKYVREEWDGQDMEELIREEESAEEQDNELTEKVKELEEVLEATKTEMSNKEAMG